MQPGPAPIPALQNVRHLLAVASGVLFWRYRWVER